MTRLVTDTTPRYCSRCRKELTDPASRECGVGPVCRNKDNHLYAKAIQANLPIAGALLLGTHTEELPVELHERFDAFKTSFLRKSEKVQKANEDIMAMKLAGSDFRDEVRELDYCLSYVMPNTLREKLIKIVEALGYVGLAGVLTGEASKSKAKIWFEDGRVWLSGTASTPGFFQMRKIPGIQTPRYRGDKTPYSAPASEADKFFSVVRKFWPLYDNDIENLTKVAKDWVNKNPQAMQMVQAAPPPRVRETARIRLRSEDFTLSFPWVKGENMYALINGLKEVPYNARKYNPDTKSWSFKMAHLEHVKTQVAKIFEDAIVEETDKVTPADLYKAPKKGSRGGARRRRYRRRY